MDIAPKLLSSIPPPSPANPYQYTPGATIGPGSSFGTKTYNTSTGGNSNIYSYAGGNPNFNEQTGQYTNQPGAQPTSAPAVPQPYNGPTFTPTPAATTPQVSQDDLYRSMTPRQIKDSIRFPAAPAATPAAPTPYVMPAPAPPAAQMPAFDGLQNFLNALISGQF